MSPPASARRRTPGPSVPRRMSGPGAGAVAAPLPRLPLRERSRPARRPVPRRPARDRPGASANLGGTLPRRLWEALVALPDHRLLDRLIRGRGWIALLAFALIGIVAMQVSLLKLNTGIGRTVGVTSALERQNAALQAEVSQLSSEDRVQAQAQRLGMVIAPAGVVRFLRARPGRDARRAAAMLRPPSGSAASGASSTSGAASSSASTATTASATPGG